MVAIKRRRPVLPTLPGVVAVVGSIDREHGYVVDGKQVLLVLMKRQLRSQPSSLASTMLAEMTAVEKEESEVFSKGPRE